MSVVNDASPLRHVPRLLREPPPAAVDPLVRTGREGRLVLYLGAGVSRSSPSSGPSGNDVADQLRPFAAELLGVDVGNVTAPNLEALAERVELEVDERLPALKVRAAEAWHFRDMEPNYAHEVIALLLREGLVTVVSANWDCGVENGGKHIEIVIEGVSSALDRLNLASGKIPIYKVHGCATRPETLVLTRSEINEPRTWARAEVQGSLAGGRVAFVGLGTLGSYVGEPVRELVGLWTADGTTICVVDPNGPSEAWREVLGETAHEVELRFGADEFMDHVVRAVALDALSRVEQEARTLHDSEQQDWSAATLNGSIALRRAFADSPGDAVLRWWRDGVIPSMDGRQFIFEAAGQVCLLCVAQLAGRDGPPLQVSGTDGALTVRSPARYFEIGCAPGMLRDAAERSARARIERRRRNGRYTAGAPVTVAIHGAKGAFPDPRAPVDIAGVTPEPSNIAAAFTDAILVVRAEDATNGALLP